jgi:tetratricopeptide (TPR) repeat protein/transcriptional regulator with XRE-family HTH domain
MKKLPVRAWSGWPRSAAWRAGQPGQSGSRSLGRPDEALADFDHVIEADLNYPAYHFDRGNLFSKVGRHAEALADYEAAMRLSPPFPELYYNRGDLRADSGHPDLLYNRGFAHEAVGRPHDAIADYTLALQDTRADRAAVLYRRGRCHAALAEFAAAHDDLDAHLALGDSPYQQEINELRESCRQAADACTGPLKSRAAHRPVRELGQMVAENDAEALGRRLREARLAALLSIEELAARAGVSVRAISDLERGRTRKPYPRTVRSLSAALGLAGAAGGPVPNGQVNSSAATGFPREGHNCRWLSPAQLPAGTRAFCGRRAELATLTGWRDDGAAGDSMVIVAIGGAAGVGKTALALRWAHQIKSSFPDGQLYVDLQGFGPSGQPVPPGEAIARSLIAVGVPAQEIPSGDDDRAGLYRSVLAGRRVIVVLDNACDEAQVRPLLPASPGCLVIVTSRNQLGGLAVIEAAQLLTLDVMSERDASGLLAARLGAGRVAEEPDAVHELIALCARLPLALAIIAARAMTRPGLPLAALVRELSDVRGRLDALGVGEVTADLRAVFSWSDQRLSPATARVFRLIGLHPGPDITIPAVASLTGVELHQASAAVAELARAHLIAEQLPVRFSSHDLLRAYAAELAGQLPEPFHLAAIHRMLDHYLHTAAAAARLLGHIDPPAQRPGPAPGTCPEQVTDRAGAYAWLEAERAVVSAVVSTAAQHSMAAHAWQLAQVMREFYQRRGHWRELLATQRAALAAATRAGDLAAQAASRWALGTAFNYLRRDGEAHDQLSKALDVYRSLADQQGECRTHFQLGRLFLHRADYRASLSHCRRSLRLARAGGHVADEAHALNMASLIYARLGDGRLALTCCQRALALHRRTGTRLGEARSLQLLGDTCIRAGDPQQAITLLSLAASIYREAGDCVNHAAILDTLGDAWDAAGHHATARGFWHEAYATVGKVDHFAASVVRCKLLVQPGKAALP